ncbi:hypothetical protein M404DRAFT_1001806 [Pisolithus tinctorius Marx 270]|uniref:RRM domain-containing protein n=1 Tax=Pisolithus tinctorius Marx 270 TaxID=870435 RepID=A0A0C3JZS9_PISTI|nr:hypothetical protein M404DRAFT_1001806 [Pisolithus tinctorius Marx 270]
MVSSPADLQCVTRRTVAFKRLITPVIKPPGFGFVEYEDSDSSIRCINLLNGVELPALEGGCASKKLLVHPELRRQVRHSLKLSCTPLCFIHNMHLRSRWRQTWSGRLPAEEAADGESRAYEEREAENLRIESEEFLARQMEDIQALAEEQHKAGMLLDDGALVKLNVSLLGPAPVDKLEPHAQKEVVKGAAAVFGLGEEEEGGIKKWKL